ncbi:MAG: AsmA-like C-terminal region-containing protein [Hyphomicrobiaceae bacterium]|nr:AsmA-like C-terminal region-containing protein [Hyphomicrobiaceae bacterium]
MVVLPVVLLAGIALGLAYFRLMQGELRLPFLVASIEAALKADLPGLSPSIENVVVKLTDSGAIEARIVRLTLRERDGDIALEAPEAAVAISPRALLSLTLAPYRIELIEPTLALSHDERSGLKLRLAGSPASAPPGTTDPSGRAPPPREPAAGKPAPSSPARPAAAGTATGLDLGALVSRNRLNGTGSDSYLRELGIRDANVRLDASGRTSHWHLPHLDIELDRSAGQPVVTGSARLSTGGQHWTLTFKSEAVGADGAATITATVRDAWPRAIGDAIPQLAALRAVEAPVAADVRVDLAADGTVTTAGLDLGLGSGRLAVGDQATAGVPIESGLLRFTYDGATRAVVLAPSRVEWASSRVDLGGEVIAAHPARDDDPAAPANAAWRFKLNALPGSYFVAEPGDAPTPVDVWHLAGTFDAATGRMRIDEATLAAGGGEVRMSGDIETASMSTRLEAVLSPMSSSAFELLWPRMAGEPARIWYGQAVDGGRIESGTLKLLSGRFHEPTPADRRLGLTYRLSAAITAADITTRPMPGLPVASLSRALLIIETDTIEVTLPAGTTASAGGEPIALKSGRFAARGLSSGLAEAELSFQFAGPAGAIQRYLAEPALGLRPPEGLDANALSGAVAGEVAMSFPMASDLTRDDIKLTAKAKITDGAVDKAVSGAEIKGGAIDVAISDRALDAKGQVLVAGVPAKLTWQHIFTSEQRTQPPLRLSAVLDDADRRQLGLELGSAVTGDVPVEVTVTPEADGHRRVRLRAELNGADLAVDSLAWHKPPGRTAYLESGIERRPDGSIALSDLKIAGDDIAVEGSLSLDDKQKVREFAFPRFSLNLITRLDISGRRASDGIWKVTVRGPTYDARRFFATLFNVGRVRGDVPVEPAATGGVDVTAEVDNVIGHNEVSLRNARMTMSRRKGRLSELSVRGILDGGAGLEVDLVRDDRANRVLRTTTTDAGQAFKLVNFYPNLTGGRMRLDVDLDGRGDAEKSGVLYVDRFRVLGDPVVSEVLAGAESTTPGPEGRRVPKGTVTRQVFEFDQLRAPFSVGHGQFVIEDAQVRGALIGATLRGTADFGRSRLDLGGTYVPLQGLSNALGGIPVLGELLSGPRREGLFGFTYAIQGEMRNPQVVVNYLSVVAPGIFREIFQMSPDAPRVQPRAPAPPATGTPRASGSAPVKSEPTPARQTVDGWQSETRR